jgi:transcriptional regulator with XRE-family HTH domain
MPFDNPDSPVTPEDRPTASADSVDGGLAPDQGLPAAQFTGRTSHDGSVETEGYAKALGARLRAVRKEQQLSLLGVEKKSSGKWKAVVVGSYERGDRAVSVRRLQELAEFYDVSVSDLLPPEPATAPGARTAPASSRIVLDLHRVASLTDPDADTLKRFVVSIQFQRAALGNRTLGVRQEDLRALALMYDCSVPALTKRLIGWQVLASAHV